MKMRQGIPVLMVVVATGVASAGSLLADDTNAAPAATVDDKINRLEQEIQDLKHQREIDQQQAQQQAQQQSAQASQPAKPAPFILAGSDGFGFESADSNFVLRVGGYAQADGRFYLDDRANNGADTFLMRRVRPILQGTLYRDFDFRIMPDLGNGAASTTILQDAYVEWHYWPWLKIRAGKFKVPVGLEWLQEDRWTDFAERGLPTDLVPQRDVGIQVSGDLLGGVVSYAGGVFNGVVDGGIADFDTSDSKDGAARIFIRPFKTTDIDPLKGLGLGVGGSIGNEEASSTTTNLASYKTPGQNTFFSFSKGVAPNGLEYRLAPQGYYYWGPLGVLGEYTIADQELQTSTHRYFIHNNAWQVAGTFVLTGEDASYNGVIPRHPFNPRVHDWGALELLARFGALNVDPDAFGKNPTAAGVRFADPTKSAQNAREWGVGLNWYLNRNLKFVLDYDRTWFSGGAGSETATAYTIVNREAEQVLIGRVQFTF
jgi:phosphate-selective porin OprO/OprP